MLEFDWIEGDGPGFEDARTVRRAVFVEEQGYSLIGEFDAQDADSLHIIGRQGGAAVCTGRMFGEGQGVLHIGRVAVLKTLRGTGAGLTMMAYMADKARELGAQTLVLNAQADKTGFYNKAGYTATGRTSLDEGVPHVEMMMAL